MMAFLKKLPRALLYSMEADFYCGFMSAVDLYRFNMMKGQGLCRSLDTVICETDQFKRANIL